MEFENVWFFLMIVRSWLEQLKLIANKKSEIISRCQRWQAVTFHFTEFGKLKDSIT